MAEVQPDPIAGLVDIPLPPAVSLWPQTVTSRVAIAAAVVLLALALASWLRRRHRNRYRREALAELDRIERALPAQPVAALASLVRRTAIAAFSRETVAPLSGAAWLAFLDRTCPGVRFSEGPGRALASGPYDPTPPDAGPLIALARRWIEHHA